MPSGCTLSGRSREAPWSGELPMKCAPRPGICGETKMRVLIVEDDAELAGILRSALSEKLWTVEMARDGESAKHLALTEDFDLVILDIMIPRIDGVAVCRAMREAGKATPVIMLTARDGVADRIFGLDAGADDYIVKPFDLGELFARIRA